MSGFTVITSEIPSAFALPNPSEPKYIVTVSGGASGGSPVSSQQYVSVNSPKEASAAPTTAAAATAAAAPGRTIEMTGADGRRYVCALAPESPQPGSESHPSSQLQSHDPGSDPASDPSSTAKSPFELLEAMTSLCLYRQEAVWTYEVCYKKQARQFRQDGTEDFICGKYPGDEQQDSAIQSDSSSMAHPIRYVSHTLNGGANCVMTGEPRTAEIRFTCLPDTTDNSIVAVKEFPTCNYVFVVATPFLCKHPDFRPPPEPRYAIACEPAPSSDAPPHDVSGSEASVGLDVEERFDADESTLDEGREDGEDEGDL